MIKGNLKFIQLNRNNLLVYVVTYYVRDKGRKTKVVKQEQKSLQEQIRKPF